MGLLHPSTADHGPVEWEIPALEVRGAAHAGPICTQDLDEEVRGAEVVELQRAELRDPGLRTGGSSQESRPVAHVALDLLQEIAADELIDAEAERYEDGGHDEGEPHCQPCSDVHL